jgi:type IV secretion system protein VirB8
MTEKLHFHTPSATAALYSDAKDWYSDRYQAVYGSRRRWFVTAWIALFLASLEAATLVILLPLKSSVPFLIKEELSGAITTVSSLSGSSPNHYDDAVRKFFLGRYVVFRETYDRMDLASNYQAVVLMSDRDVSASFRAAIASDNPNSPVVMYGARGRRLIRIKSIAFLSQETAQVRFTASEEKSLGSAKNYEYIATTAFRFCPVPTSEAARLVNPLGFTVTNYRVDQEVVP